MDCHENMDMLEQDVVVIGAGMAGLTAAIEAAAAGVRVIVIDKLPRLGSDFQSFSRGGRANDTARSMGGGLARFSANKLVEKLADRGVKCGEGAQDDSSVEQLCSRHLERGWGRVDSNLIRAYLERVFDDCRWFRDELGAPYENRMIKGNGPGLMAHLYKAAEDRGVRMAFETKAMRLVEDPSGRIKGVRARNGNGLLDLEALAVVLASGSFGGNQEMMLKYVGPEITYNTIPTGCPTNTGDGHLMALEIGAQLVHLSVCHIRTMDKYFGVGPSRGLPNIFPMGIYMNHQCRRFVDEGIADSDTIGNAIAFQPESKGYLIFDEKARAMYPEEYEGYPGKEDVIQVASTIEALAGKMNVSHEKLKELIDGFNGAVEAGRASRLPIPKTEHACKIDSPPFYCFCPVLPGLNHPLGGLKTDAGAQVMDRDGNPIKGLYAAGSIQNWSFGQPFEKDGVKSYMGSYHAGASSGLATALVFGRIAGRNAAEQALRHDRS